MDHKYFLDGGIEYQPQNRELKINGKITSLQCLENTLLNYFVTHPDQVINKETLYKIGWAGRICDDNPLTKAISTLRAKLKDNHRAPRYIKTIHKQGFKFISQVSQCPYETGIAVLVAKRNLTIKKSLWYCANIIILLFITVTIVMVFFDHKTAPKVSNIHQLTYNSGQKKSPNLSADKQYVAFSRQLSQQSYAQLVIKPLNGTQEIVLTKAPYHHTEPKWDSKGEKLLYHRHDLQSCEVVLMSINTNLTVTKQKVLLNCNQHQPPFGLSWGPDNSFFYTDKDPQTQNAQIYQFDMKTRRKTLFASSSNVLNFGFVQLNFDPDSQRLLTLHQSDNHNKQLISFDLNASVHRQQPLNWSVQTISAYKGEPVYKTAKNHIHYRHKTKESRLMQSPHWSIAFPNMNSEPQPTMVFVGGGFNNSALIKVDIKNRSEQIILPPEVSHQLPLYTPSGNIYYLADHSGILQLFKRRKNQSQPLSQFEKNLLILSLSISNDEKYLALTTPKAVLLFDLKQLPLSLKKPLLSLSGYLNPHFSPDNQLMWASIATNNDYAMHAIKLPPQPSKQPIQIINHAFLGLFDQKTQEHFAFKFGKKGIFRVNKGRLGWYADSPPINDSHSVGLYNHQLYSIKQNKIIRSSLDNGQTIELVDAPYRHFSLVTLSSNQQPDQIIATKAYFSHTNIYFALYQ